MRRNSGFLCCAVLLLLFAAGGPLRAGACGVCREDDLAGVYTYEAQQLVQANPVALAFVLIKVEGTMGPFGVSRLQSWLRRVRGIDASTVRVSPQQRVVGFVMRKRSSQSQLLDRLTADFPDLAFRLVPDQGLFR